MKIGNISGKFVYLSAASNVPNTTKNASHGQRTPSSWIAVTTGLVLFAYPLSIGPVAWLDRNRWLPKPVMDVVLMFYFPLDWLYDHSDWFRQLFEWYLRFWT